MNSVTKLFFSSDKRKGNCGNERKQGGSETILEEKNKKSNSRTLWWVGWVHHRTNKTNNWHIHTKCRTIIYPEASLWTGRGSLSTMREPIWTWGEHANSTQSIKPRTSLLWGESANHCTSLFLFLLLLNINFRLLKTQRGLLHWRHSVWSQVCPAITFINKQNKLGGVEKGNKILYLVSWWYKRIHPHTFWISLFRQSRKIFVWITFHQTLQKQIRTKKNCSTSPNTAPEDIKT